MQILLGWDVLIQFVSIVEKSVSLSSGYVVLEGCPNCDSSLLIQYHLIDSAHLPLFEHEPLDDYRYRKGKQKGANYRSDQRKDAAYGSGCDLTSIAYAGHGDCNEPDSVAKSLEVLEAYKIFCRMLRAWGRVEAVLVVGPLKDTNNLSKR